MARFLVGALLLAHGGVHLLYLIPVPGNDPNWPFLLDQSWVVPESIRRGAGSTAALVVAAVYLLVALGVWGVPWVNPAVRILLIAGSVMSLLLFAAYWHPWLGIGTAIALGLLAVAITEPEWWVRTAG